MLNSRLGLFTAALSGLHPNRAPLLPKYGVILPSSLTRVLSITLGFSPRLPVSVCGTGTSHLARGFFLAVWNQELRYYISLAITAQPYGKRICLFPSLTAWTRISNTALTLSSCVPHCSNGEEVVQEYQPVVHRLRLSASA